MSEQARVPSVFISYSHDSKEHKQWVLEFAIKLRNEGVEVTIDQWDLEFGDDIPKFMEHWVSNAERVLMICTEPYVQKVDDGRGGAGYEAMVVTQQLVRDLGTKKFIPVIRQTNIPILLPKCIGTRMGLNLSNYADSEHEFKKLVSQLHQVPPETKPPLGPSPTIKVAVLPSEVVTSPSASSADPSGAYNQALVLARAGDMVRWRRLVVAHRIAVAEPLLKWRESTSHTPPTLTGQLPDFVCGALTPYQALFAVALAGIESEQPKFNQQSSLVHDLRELRGWEPIGRDIIDGIPEAVAWVFQSLAGAMCIYTSQSANALDLGCQRVKERYDDASKPLFLAHSLTGWPSSLDTSCRVAWVLLWELPKRFPWVVEAFVTEDAYRESLCGYYSLLSWLEYIELLKTGRADDFIQNDYRPEVPAIFIRQIEISRGLRKLLEDREPLKSYGDRQGVSIALQLENWPHWVHGLQNWLGRVFEGYCHAGSELIHFAEDLHR